MPFSVAALLGSTPIAIKIIADYAMNTPASSQLDYKNPIKMGAAHNCFRSIVI
jgi:hypothetical protein